MYYKGFTFFKISFTERIVKSVRDQAAYAVKRVGDTENKLNELLEIAKKGAGFAEVF